jgi:hypothetical protein
MNDSDLQESVGDGPSADAHSATRAVCGMCAELLEIKPLLVGRRNRIVGVCPNHGRVVIFTPRRRDNA